MRVLFRVRITEERNVFGINGTGHALTQSVRSKTSSCPIASNAGSQCVIDQKKPLSHQKARKK
jgi:hypothetical protein